ncbi:peptidase inhibitor I78 [Brevundimonas sp. FT23028]|uniref:peptidase inhibitor I78 n=1 Tax=Brevundimonas sp. FT23028 TaxID=3393748 RepID=UPI003B58AFD4
MRLIAAAAVVGLAAACAPSQPVVEPTTPQTCDAAGAGSLIGRHVGAVDFAAGANVRIVCTTCPTTRDYRPDRLNVRFDQSTGLIRQVDCG